MTYAAESLAYAVPYSEWEEGMLKISLIDSQATRLVVEGKLIAPWTAELRSASGKAKAGREDFAG